ncbi:hypothetical protein BTVI_66996 [Pitangus sulphuratus]|nr:hypothetical protein BTVI_66996 [Pitangus sulphuratus]
MEADQLAVHRPMVPQAIKEEMQHIYGLVTGGQTPSWALLHRLSMNVKHGLQQANQAVKAFLVQRMMLKYKHGGIKLLDQVQRRDIRIIGGMELLSYEERLREPGLFSLEKRSFQGDLTGIFQYLESLQESEVNINNTQLSKPIKGQKTEQVEKNAAAKMYQAFGSGMGIDFCKEGKNTSESAMSQIVLLVISFQPVLFHMLLDI